MANRFLDFYNSELDALRRRAGRFAAAHPKIAGRLRLAPDVADDPNIERLIQSFAYTAARVRQKLDDGLPELTDGLLETLYPHYLAPLPALTILSFAPDAMMDGVQEVPRGTEVTSDRLEGDRVRFATTQSVPLAPVRLTDIRLNARPFEAPPAPDGSASCLRLTVEPMGQVPLCDMGLTHLRTYLSGPPAQAHGLARLLLQSTRGVTLAAHASDEYARRLPASALTPAGFDADTALIPWPTGSFTGYRTLVEFAALPEKFLFFDIALGPVRETDRLDIYVFFDAPLTEPLSRVQAGSITLHASPAINLFPARAEPVALDGSRSNYPLAADARRPRTRAVHSVRGVTVANADGSTLLAAPLFHRLTDRRPGEVYWHLRRHAVREDAPEDVGATTLAFVDHRGVANTPNGGTASIDILSTNGTLARKLPFGGGQPRLSLSSPLDHVAGVNCLRAPTPPRPPRANDARAWQLMSHLSLNHLSLQAGGAAVLRDILRLYDPGDGPEMAQMIHAVDDLNVTTGLARIDGVSVTGTDIVLTFDDGQIDPAQAVLFAAVLDRFFGCYTTLNTFTRLTVRMKDRTDTLARFPARAGEGALI
ncbi:type VI secretion system baseplate subunit TssF [Tateyamaria omphalii]|uniref:type VI secretion system baseplate subunit TssF n=1 Tax=Tateyamaria omphalii TaxID=299262 RepID=UPI001C99D469|nr:type VI secretion system baseplate subunit TssF [Tateyamaria omphalii]MBY5931948.1 type VI secretion system baseplate subunit TssF [Tateyamaria omphalii]